MKPALDGNWVPWNPLDSGAFGKEVVDRLSEEMNGRYGKGRFATDLLVNNSDRKIFRYDAPTGLAGHTQIDLVYFLDGYHPAEGEVLDSSKILVYEIKTSAFGDVDPPQLNRLQALQGSWRSVRIVTSPIKFSGGQLIANPTFADRKNVWTASSSGALKTTVATTAFVALTTADAEMAYAAYETEFKRAFDFNPGTFDRRLQLGVAMQKLKEYIDASSYGLAGDSLDITAVVLYYSTVKSLAEARF